MSRIAAGKLWEAACFRSCGMQQFDADTQACNTALQKNVKNNNNSNCGNVKDQKIAVLMVAGLDGAAPWNFHRHSRAGRPTHINERVDNPYCCCCSFNNYQWMQACIICLHFTTPIMSINDAYSWAHTSAHKHYTHTHVHSVQPVNAWVARSFMLLCQKVNNSILTVIKWDFVNSHSVQGVRSNYLKFKSIKSSKNYKFPLNVNWTILMLW